MENCRHKLKHRKRPESVETREEFGHLEMDLIEGKNHKNFIITLTEIKYRFLIMRKLKYAKELAKTVKYLKTSKE
jgi:IS30 family transposase